MIQVAPLVVLVNSNLVEIVIPRAMTSQNAQPVPSTSMERHRRRREHAQHVPTSTALRANIGAARVRALPTGLIVTHVPTSPVQVVHAEQDLVLALLMDLVV